MSEPTACNLCYQAHPPTGRTELCVDCGAFTDFWAVLSNEEKATEVQWMLDYATERGTR